MLPVGLVYHPFVPKKNNFHNLDFPSCHSDPDASGEESQAKRSFVVPLLRPTALRASGS